MSPSTQQESIRVREVKVTQAEIGVDRIGAQACLAPSLWAEAVGSLPW